jgi:hypothetical protein
LPVFLPVRPVFAKKIPVLYGPVPVFAKKIPALYSPVPVFAKKIPALYGPVPVFAKKIPVLYGPVPVFAEKNTGTLRSGTGPNQKKTGIWQLAQLFGQAAVGMCGWFAGAKYIHKSTTALAGS